MFEGELISGNAVEERKNWHHLSKSLTVLCFPYAARRRGVVRIRNMGSIKFHKR
jgi:hypothetical protein